MTKKENDAEEDVKEQPARARRLGFLNGELKVPEDFDTMGAREIEEMFYGETDVEGGDADETR